MLLEGRVPVRRVLNPALHMQNYKESDLPSNVHQQGLVVDGAHNMRSIWDNALAEEEDEPAERKSLGAASTRAIVRHSVHFVLCC